MHGAVSPAGHTSFVGGSPKGPGGLASGHGGYGV